MTKIQDIYDFLCRLAPVETQMDFDNSGFLVGHINHPVSRVLLSLDITDEVIEEAASMKAELILSHHPLIFRPIKCLTDTENGRKPLRLAELGIAAICMHTNLDIAQGGVNDVLIRALGASSDAALDEEGCGRIGHLAGALPLSEFLQRCREVLKTGGLRYYDAGRAVRKLAVMGGSGGDAIETAFAMGCDTYVTADIKYHQFLLAKELGINLIDGDHFCTENLMIPVLADMLSAEFIDVSFNISKVHRQVIQFA